MAFMIIVRNDGEDGTVEVTERINLNERRVVFDGFIGNGESLDVACVGEPDKDFTWVHRASNLSGGPEALGDGDTLRVNS
jgi:hypothetical protein